MSMKYVNLMLKVLLWLSAETSFLVTLDFTGTTEVKKF